MTYSAVQVIVGLTLIIVIPMAFTIFGIAQLQLNLTVESHTRTIHCDTRVVYDACHFCCNVFSFCLFFEFANVVLLIKYHKQNKQHNIHNNNLFQHILMDQLTQMLAILVLLVVIQQGLSYYNYLYQSSHHKHFLCL